jgi:hypothetical protein
MPITSTITKPATAVVINGIHLSFRPNFGNYSSHRAGFQRAMAEANGVVSSPQSLPSGLTEQFAVELSYGERAPTGRLGTHLR